MADTDVGAALGELERKLQDLEEELRGVPRDVPRAAGTAPPVVAAAPAPSLAPAPVASATAPALAPVLAPAPAPAPVAPTPVAPAGPDLAELDRAREELERTAREFTAAYDRALAALRTATDAAVAAAPGGPPAAADVAAPGPPAAGLDDAELDGNLSVDAGPFTDIATLSAFEQAMGAVPGVRSVRVRGFEGSCAFLDVALDRPVALGAELRRRAPVAFTLTQAGPGRVSIAVEPRA